MKATWPKVRLGEVLRHRKEFVTIDDLTIYRRPRVQLHAQGIVLRDEMPGALIKTKQQQVCQAGELLVAEIDAKVGGFGIVPQSLDGAIVSSHYFLFGIDEAASTSAKASLCHSLQRKPDLIWCGRVTCLSYAAMEAKNFAV